MKKTYKFTLPKEKEVECVIARVENGKVVVDVEFNRHFEPEAGDVIVAKMAVYYCITDGITHISIAVSLF